MNFEEYRPALEAAGFEVVVRAGEIAFGEIVGREGRNWQHINPFGSSDRAESVLRSTVLKYAPMSYAHPYCDHEVFGGDNSRGVFIRIRHDPSAGLVRDDFPSLAEGPDYPTAWLNALKALFDAGLVPEVKE